MNCIYGGPRGWAAQAISCYDAALSSLRRAEMGRAIAVLGHEYRTRLALERSILEPRPLGEGFRLDAEVTNYSFQAAHRNKQQ